MLTVEPNADSQNHQTLFTTVWIHVSAYIAMLPFYAVCMYQTCILDMHSLLRSDYRRNYKYIDRLKLRGTTV